MILTRTRFNPAIVIPGGMINHRISLQIIVIKRVISLYLPGMIRFYKILL